MDFVIFVKRGKTEENISIWMKKSKTLLNFKLYLKRERLCREEEGENND